MMRRALAVGVALVAVAAGVFSVRVAHADPASSFSGSSPAGAVALLGAGLALTAAGLASWSRRGARLLGPLLVAGGLCWFLLEWNSPAVNSPVAFTAGLVLYASCPPFVAHAVLAFPRERLSSGFERALIVTAYADTLLIVGLLPTFFFDPAATCSDCARNLLLIAPHNSAADRLNRVGVWVAVFSFGALALLVASRALRASAAARRSGWLVFAGGVFYVGLVASIYAASLDRGFLWNGQLERRLWYGQAVALVAVSLGFAWSWARARRGRSAVSRLVVELAKSPPPGGLRDALAAIVDDPELELAYPLDDSERLIDADGRPVALSAGKEHTNLVSGGRQLAVAAHGPGVLDDDQLVAEVTSAARLALENERLHAIVLARLDELRRSRARIVEAGDGERRRLERDLHDGAQQHLVGLSLSLRLLRTRHAADAGARLAEILEAADADLQAAIEGLRELAHGIFPAVLADGGLGPAVGALAEETPVPIDVEGLSAERFAPAIESAAYMLVAETASATSEGLAVHATRADGTLALEIEARGVDGPLDGAELADRVSAADGRLELEPSNGLLRIRAEFPCAS
jgi:signal transduction histidine kinase